MKQPNRAGFTIVELIIIVTVLAILAVIGVVSYYGIQARARLQIARMEMVQVSRAAAAFREEYDRQPSSPIDFSNIFKTAGVYTSTRTVAKNYAVCANSSGYALVAWNPIVGGIKRGETLYLYQDTTGQSVHTLTNSSLESTNQIDKVCDQVYPSATLEAWSQDLP